MRIPLSSPDITDREIERVCRVLKSGILSLGPCLQEFEEHFAEFVGTRFAVAVNSGTSALHLAVKALGITHGDEVITTSFSFVASTNCFLYEGASPVFVDVDPDTFNIDPRAILHFLVQKCRREGGRTIDIATGRTVKAILPVHVFGMPCDMDAICEIAREFKLFVIEDSCEALGATLCGQKVGTFGDAAAFAFYPNKQMTTGEGGLLVTNDERIASECRSLRNQGRGPNQSWLEHEKLGYNYRLSDIHAALGIAQLERIKQLLECRAQVARSYGEELSNHVGIRIPALADNKSRSWFVYVVQIAAGRVVRDSIIGKLRTNGIGCQTYFPAIHKQSYIRELMDHSQQDLPNTDHAAATCLALPFFTRMTKDEVTQVCWSLGHALEESLVAALVTAA